MTALWIILGILAFFFVLFSIPIHVVVEADSDVRVHLRFLFVKYSLFPMKKRKKKPKTEKTAKKTKKTKKSGSAKSKKKEDTDPKKKPKRDIIGLIKLILKLVGAVLRKFPKHFRVRILRYKIVVGTKDAAKTALMYGAVTDLSARLFELLRRGTRFRVKKKSDVNVYADFLGEKIKADIGIDISLTVRGVLSMLMAAGIAFVKAKMEATSKKQPEIQENSKTSDDKNDKK